MPIVMYYYWNELNETHHFIGVCELSKQEEFHEKVKAMCKAYEWNEDSIFFRHASLNYVKDGDNLM